MPTSPRRVIAGRYELTYPLGRGGMGEVWAGYDQRLDRPVAVKLLRRDLFADGGANPSPGRSTSRHPSTGVDADQAAILRERFQREARSTARIDHPGVPAVYDAGVDAGELYLVMRIVAGIALADILAEEGALPIHRAAAVGAQLASILATAHAAALVHRDLKPANVLIAGSGHVTVLDFGIAALLEPGLARLTAADETLGSPAYMAPEQVLHAQVSPRTDLYALGCVLFEMFTGTAVFDGDSTYALMHAHVDRTPPSPVDLRPDMPPGLARLVLDLLAKDPAARPRDASEVYERLVPFVGTDASAADRPHDATRPFRTPFAPLASSVRDTVRPPGPAPSSATDEGSDDLMVDAAAVRHEAADLVEAGRVTQAAEILERALTVVGRVRPGSDGELELRLALANTRLFGEDFTGALPLYDAVRRATDDENLEIFCQYQIAVCRAATGDTSAALDDFTALLQRQSRRLGPQHPDTIEVERQIVLLMAAAGDVTNAISRLERMIRTANTVSPPPDDVDTAELRQLLKHLRQMNS